MRPRAGDKENEAAEMSIGIASERRTVRVVPPMATSVAGHKRRRPKRWPLSLACRLAKQFDLFSSEGMRLLLLLLLFLPSLVHLADGGLARTATV